MEELLKQLLEGQKQLSERLDHMDQKITALDTKMDQKFAAVDQRFATVEQRLTTIEANMVTKDEFYKAILEQQNDIVGMMKLIDKKLDKHEGKLDALNDRLFNQEAELQILKRASNS